MPRPRNISSQKLKQKIRNVERLELNRLSWQAAGLVGWWPLGAYPDSKDKSLFGGKNGVISGAVVGNIDQRRGLLFDGSNDYVQISDSPLFDLLGDFGIGCWAKSSSVADAVLMNQYDASTNDGWFILHDVSPNTYRILVTANTGAATADFSSDGAPTGDWDHVFITRTNGTIKLYVNGVLQSATGTMALALESSGALLFGKEVLTPGGQHLNGYLDDIRIYNRSLSANEVAAIHNETKDGGYGDLAALPAGSFWNIPLGLIPIVFRGPTRVRTNPRTGGLNLSIAGPNPSFVVGGGVNPGGSGILSSFIQGGQESWVFPSGSNLPPGLGNLKVDLFVSGSGASTGTDGSWSLYNTLGSGLFISGPPVGLVGSGLSPGLATLFIPAVSGYGPSQDPGTAGILPLFIGESGVAIIYNADGTAIQSGVIPLVVTGVSNMYPKEWFWNRSAVRDSSGYVPIERGITIYINGE